MDIERINENTVRFYISYRDIEERGFDREEIWYNREKGEELFWEMMSEVHLKEDFFTDGPLWIQVQALDKGLEVLVKRAQSVKNGRKIEIPLPGEVGAPSSEEETTTGPSKNQVEEQDAAECVMKFDELEDLISLSKIHLFANINTKLYYFENHYYLYCEFPLDTLTEVEMDNIYSVLSEYSEESTLTVYRLDEYGKVIFSENVFEQLRAVFPK